MASEDGETPPLLGQMASLISRQQYEIGRMQDEMRRTRAMLNQMVPAHWKMNSAPIEWFA